ncbi:MAG TPA: hypothetical protein VE344_03315 [Methylomirabilota bacterium]|nr:hypothetical protein [Methylomirabilota bacterium]
MNETQFRFQQKRNANPRHFLIYAASAELAVVEKITKEEKGISKWTPHELAAIIFSAFALEAICNSFGDKLFGESCWKDFETRSPIEKLQIVCEKLNINSSLDFRNELWSDAKWLVGFRNEVAHAKLQPIDQETTIPIAQCNYYPINSWPLSDVEKEITIGNAKRAIKVVQEILAQFYLKIKEEDRGSLFFDISFTTGSSR